MSQRLKFWLLFTLFASNLAVAAIGLLALRTMERNYAELIGQGFPTVETLRTLTRDLSALQRASLRATSTTIDGDRDRQVAHLAKTLPLVQQLESKLPNGTKLLQEDHRTAIIAKTTAYTDLVGTVLSLRTAGKHSEASQLHHEKLRPAYDDAIDAIDTGAAQTLLIGSELSRDYSTTNRRFSQAVMVLGGWPVALAGAALLFATLIAGFLLFAYRSAGDPNSP